MKYAQKRKPSNHDDFLWLISLSDLMILLFVTFVVMFSFSYKKLKQQDFQKIIAALRNQQPPQDPIDVVKTNLNEWVAEQKLSDQIAVKKSDEDVVLEIRDGVLFSVGDFAPHSEGLRLMQQLKSTLEGIPPAYKIGIEGHTDDSPIHTARIEDNWDLSAKRALAVFRALNLSPQLHKRTVVMAYGDTRPLVPNRDEAGTIIPANQAKNRRVTLRVF